MNNISLGILRALHEHKQIEGTETLANIVGAKRHLTYTNALMLARYGMIEIVPGIGRGNKTIYKDLGVLRVKNAGSRS